MGNKKSFLGCGKNEDNATAAIVAGVVAGVIAGGLLSLFLSPNTGEENREYVSRKAKKFAGDVKDTYGNVKETVSSKIKRGRNAYDDLSDDIEDAIS